jgi:small subunit ribosomal protein S29
LPNGGIVLGATSNSDFVLCPPLDVGIEMGEARAKTPQSNPAVSDFWNPLQRIDQRVMDICSNLDTLRLEGVSKEEAKSIIEYWAFNGLVRDRLADSWIGEKWTMSGGGVLGELEKAVVRMRF